MTVIGGQRTSVVGEKGESHDTHYKVNIDYCVTCHNVCESSLGEHIRRSIVRCIGIILTDSALRKERTMRCDEAMRRSKER